MSTINTLLIKRRLPDSILGAGAPASLSGGELAFNEIDSTLYYGASAGILPIAGPGQFVSRTLAQDVSGQKTFIDNTIFNNTVSMSSTLDVLSGVNALSYSITGTEVINSARVGSFTDINASGDLTVQGNLNVLGATTTIETDVTTTSAFEITNNGSQTALTVTQVDGTNDVAEFKDGIDTALIVKGSGNVGVGTFNPNEKLTVSGNLSASGNVYAVNGDFTGTLDVDNATTLGSTLYVTNSATFASSVSAAGALTVDGLATFNADVTVVDKLQVQSTDFNPGVTGTHVEVEGTDVKVVQCGATSVEATYGLDGITTVNANNTYIIATDNSQGIEINSNYGANDIDLTSTNVNITTGDLEVQVGNLNGNGTNYINDFIIDGGTF
jgi:hypothetical protein